MNILILGATGRVGNQIVNYALHDRHHVTVLVRTPEKIQINNGNLTIIQGNVLNKEDIVRAMHGIDVVISALNTDGTTTLSESMPLHYRSNGKRRHTTDYHYRNCRYPTK